MDGKTQATAGGSSVNYVEHHFGDYARDTGHLSVTEHGAYRRLMDVYYVREKPLPKVVAECCRLVQAKSTAERKAVATVLPEFFDLTEEGWTHRRCDAEIARFKDKINKAKGSANARWNWTLPHTERNANALRTYSEGNAPNHQAPNTSNQTPNTKEKKKTTHPSPTAPPDVDSQVWVDWTRLRKGKRAAITSTAIDGLRREATKAGLSLENALRIACERGWMGFKAEWLDERKVNGSHSKQAALEQRNKEASEEWLRRHQPPEPEIFDAVATERKT